MESEARLPLGEVGSSRRQLLAASAGLGAGALGGIPTVSAEADHTGQEDDSADSEVDEPEGFSSEVLAPHAKFSDDVAAAFSVVYEDEGEDATFLRDALNVVVARMTWEPGGSTGWHTHPGPVIVSVTEGELDLTNAPDCTTHTYAAGEAFVDVHGPGDHFVKAINPSETENAEILAIFLGVPDEEPTTEWVEPQDC